MSVRRLIERAALRVGRPVESESKGMPPLSGYVDDSLDQTGGRAVELALSPLLRGEVRSVSPRSARAGGSRRGPNPGVAPRVQNGHTWHT